MSAGLAIHRPTSLEAAFEHLQHYGDDARIVAGSTAVTIMLRQRLIAPAALVGIGGIEGLSGIRRVDGYLEIGALTTHRDVELSPLVREAIPVLSETFGVVANVRVRNVATVGGVLAEADYASDPPAVLLALDAEIVARGPAGERTIPIGSFFRAFYETALAPDEILTAVRVPIQEPSTGAIYEKFVTRSSEDRPCVGVIAVVRLAADGSVDDLRVAVAAAAETPQRFSDVEATARGEALDDRLA
ncbi:MAG: xanthine dehydrogenase family protein subunit M, partial [Chloroflexota bacterium]